MSTISKQADLDIKVAIVDGKNQNLVANLNFYKEQFNEALNQFSAIETAKSRAANFKHKAIDYLDSLLIDFESTFIKRGGKVLWAEDAEDACQEILKIIDKHKATKVVKSKSNLCEEIGLKDFFIQKGIELVETDTGDFIAQASNENSTHPIMPIIHKSTEEALDITNKCLGTISTNKEEATKNIRNVLKENFKQPLITITGANFLLADVGGVVITENEGNIFSCAASPKAHIVVVAIDKMLSSITELDLFLPLLSTFGTGQTITSYNTILTGPKKSDEEQGPSEMYVVLVDNGRSELLKKPEQRRAATCIKCGACLNYDQIYETIGGQNYHHVNKGIIGSIINQHVAKEEDYFHQSYMSPLDGALNKYCPVKLDFNKLLLYNRRDNAKNGLLSKTDSVSIFFWKSAVLKRSKMEKGGAKLKNFMLRQFFKKSWGEQREMPKIVNTSFNDWWRAGRK